MLVVEDDRKTIFIYEKYLSMAGFQVVPARTIDDARRGCSSRTRPAAIVLDIMLESETTWDFLAELKRDPRDRATSRCWWSPSPTGRRRRARWAPTSSGSSRSTRTGCCASCASRRPRRPAKVLVIDDDETARYLIRKLLTRHALRADRGRDRRRRASRWRASSSRTSSCSTSCSRT